MSCYIVSRLLSKFAKTEVSYRKFINIDFKIYLKVLN